MRQKRWLILQDKMKSKEYYLHCEFIGGMQKDEYFGEYYYLYPMTKREKMNNLGHTVKKEDFILISKRKGGGLVRVIVSNFKKYKASISIKDLFIEREKFYVPIKD